MTTTAQKALVEAYRRGFDAGWLACASITQSTFHRLEAGDAATAAIIDRLVLGSDVGETGS